MSTPASLPLNRILAWLGTLLLAGLAVWLLAPVLTPFVAAAVLAYVLHPLVLRLGRLGLPHSLSVVLVEALALITLLGLLLLLVPVLVPMRLTWLTSPWAGSHRCSRQAGGPR